jgi:hypothetical protein
LIGNPFLTGQSDVRTLLLGGVHGFF